jgi:hypothetical protein
LSKPSPGSLATNNDKERKKGITMPLQRTVLFLMTIFFVSLVAAEPPAACLKQVFEGYCLGGDFQQLLRQRPGGMPAQSEGDRSAMVYTQGRERLYVMAYQGRIYKILHTYEPTGQTTLKELQQHLEGKYGPFRDESHYPLYARALASQIGAIRRGEGELRYVWQRPDQAWRIELAWTRTLGISLAYLANELDAKQQEATLLGL